jgi:hypothetical protein
MNIKMTDAVQKLSVYDDRIVQTQPKYAVEKGALSLTNAPYTALSQTASQHTYNITVPSEGVFIDRAVEWRSQCFLSFVATPNTNTAGVPCVVLGRDVALASFPLHSLVQTMTATINDATVTMNTGDVLYEVMRLTDYNKNRIQRTCPNMLDTYGSYNDAFATNRNPLGDYMSSTSRADIPNGAWGQFVFTQPNGQALTGSGTYTSGGQTVTYTNGIPVQDSAVASYPIFVSFYSNEKLVLSPFIFSDIHEMDTGMFGVQNIQLVMNLTSPSQTSPVGRVLRSCSNVVAVSAVGYNSGTQSGSPFSNSRVNVQFLTPSLSIPLPAKSVVPYYEFPRYVSNQALVNSAGGSGIGYGQVASVQSQTITLPCIPDLIIIYCKPQSYGTTDADWYLPLTQISINFDNFSGLLASHTTEELYAMSVMNGLEMDYNTWLGYTQSANKNGATPPPASGYKTQLCGGFLVLKPSKDITLQEGQAPSVVGNYTFQFNATVSNWSQTTVSNATLYIITANSGYFETVKGSSRVIKGVLNEADVINAPMSSAGTRSNLTRIIGGRGALHKLGNVLGRVKEFHSMGSAKSGGAMSAGAESGGAESGGAMSGGRRGQRAGLASRLM